MDFIKKIKTIVEKIENNTIYKLITILITISAISTIAIFTTSLKQDIKDIFHSYRLKNLKIIQIEQKEADIPFVEIFTKDIYINAGSNQGVKVGDYFAIIYEVEIKDGEKTIETYCEEKGLLKVKDVLKNTSITNLVELNIEKNDIYIGDKVKFIDAKLIKEYSEIENINSLKYGKEIRDRESELLELLSKAKKLVESQSDIKIKEIKELYDDFQPYFFGETIDYENLLKYKNKLDEFLRNYPNSYWDSKIMYDLGWTNYRLGRYNDAISVFSEFIIKYPNSISLKGAKGFIKESELRNKIQNNVTDIKYHEQLAEYLIDNNDFHKAIVEYIFLYMIDKKEDTFKKIIDTMKKCEIEKLEIKYSFACRYFKNGNYKRAIDLLSDIVCQSDWLKPDVIKHSNRLLILSYYYTNNFNKSIELIKSSLINYPDDCELMDLAGTIFYNNNKFNDSEKYYNDALNLDKANNNVRINLCELFIYVDNYSEAQKLLKEGSLYFNNEYIVYSKFFSLIIDVLMNKHIDKNKFRNIILDSKNYKQELSSYDYSKIIQKLRQREIGIDQQIVLSLIEFFQGNLTEKDYMVCWAVPRSGGLKSLWCSDKGHHIQKRG